MHSFLHFSRATVCGPWSGQPSVWPVLLCDIIFRKKIRLQYKWNFPSVYSLTFLNSIWSFPDASEALENQVNADIAEVCSVIWLCLFYGALNYLSIFWIHAYAIKCPDKLKFLVYNGMQEMFFRLAKKSLQVFLNQIRR